MAHPLILAVDLGTTACKAAVFSRDGRVLALAYREYPLIKLSKTEIEQDADVWWRLVKQVCLDATGGLSLNQRHAIKAMGLSVQGISFVPVDVAGSPLCNAFVWLDARATAEAEALKNLWPEEEIFALTGLRANPLYTLPKIMWLKKHRGDLFARTHRFCTAQDYILSRLTGEFVTDYSVAGGTLLHEVSGLKWSKKLAAAVPINLEQLPGLNWSGTAVGNLYSSLAGELSLPAGLPVILGGHDQECAGIGAGLRAGEVTISLGTASILLAQCEKPVIDPVMRIPCLPSVERNNWVLEAPVSVGGAGLRWLRDSFNALSTGSGGNGWRIDYEKVTGLASSAPVGASGILFFPHLAGATAPFWISSASGAFHGISLASTIFDLVRSVVEGWIFQIKTNLITLEELAGSVERVIVFAGAVRNSFITQMVADVLGKPVAVAETPETALLGASILAGVGAGIYRDVSSGQAESVRTIRVIQPRKAFVRDYEEIYGHYREAENRFLAIGD